MKLIALMVVMFGCSLYAEYRFICNGILASGEERSDECGVCNEKTAARWANPNIPVVVAESPLPKGFNLNDWLGVVADSFKAWEIDGSSLRFIKVAGQSKRQFGANEALHEIFWITNKDEWRKLVGSGEYGTLGATLPTYTCGDEEGGRVIVDADLALNGVGYINWQPRCDNDNCFSVKTTVLHELGHYFGADHGCVDCDTSIMSARARPGFNLHYPLYDDMAVTRVLYPDGSKGGFGFPCVDDKDCAVGNLCIADGANRYCSNRCQNDTNCDHGAICQALSGNNVCTFMNGSISSTKRLSENCSKTPCAEPLICAGASEDNYFCFMGCKVDADCGQNQLCVETNNQETICMTVKSLGEGCDHQELCTKGLYCIFEGLFSGVCRGPCSEGCRPNESCQTIAGAEVCMPKMTLKLDDKDRFDQKNLPAAGPRNKKPTAIYKSACQVSPNEPNYLWIWLLTFALVLFIKSRRKHLNC